MESSEPILNGTTNPWLDRFQAFFEVLVVSGLISSFVAALPFTLFKSRNSSFILQDVRFVTGFVLFEATITLLLIAALLKAHGEKLEAYGLRMDRFRANFRLGLVVVPLLFLVNILISVVFKAFLPQYSMDRNPLMDTIHSWPELVLFIISALFAGGIKEEVQRAFIITRFDRYLGGARVGLVLWSLAFGLGHYIQGVQGIVVATLFGVVFGAIYIARRNLVAPIVAHGLYDTMALLGYWFFLK
jgi:uncharacterized protein